MSVQFGFRKLKEQQKRKKIDHPLSKYNNLGQLTCIVCSLPLKNELLWESHLLSKKHKEAVTALKAETASGKNSMKKPNAASKVYDAPPAKKTKHEASPRDLAVKSVLKNAEEDALSLRESEKSVNSALPSDFFDSAPTQSTKTDSEHSNARTRKDSAHSEDQSITPSASMSISEKLPEGFFDDAKMDAKVRKVEYVDKKEEEWEEFQKMIAEETKVSENLQAEEEDEIKVERDLAEYGTLKQYLTRVDKLKQKRETQKTVADSHKRNIEDDDSQGEDTSEDELDDILNWRAKKA